MFFLKESHFCLFEYLGYRRICVREVWRKTGSGYPCGFGDVFFPLWCEVCRVGVEHAVPPCVLQMPFPVPSVAMVGDAYKVAELQFVDAGLFLHFAQSCGFYLFSGILVPFRKVPQTVSADEKEVASAYKEFL